MINFGCAALISLTLLLVGGCAPQFDSVDVRQARGDFDTDEVREPSRLDGLNWEQRMQLYQQYQQIEKLNAIGDRLGVSD